MSYKDRQVHDDCGRPWTEHGVEVARGGSPCWTCPPLERPVDGSPSEGDLR